MAGECISSTFCYRKMKERETWRLQLPAFLYYWHHNMNFFLNKNEVLGENILGICVFCHFVFLLSLCQQTVRVKINWTFWWTAILIYEHKMEPWWGYQSSVTDNKPCRFTAASLSFSVFIFDVTNESHEFFSLSINIQKWTWHSMMLISNWSRVCFN